MLRFGGLILKRKCTFLLLSAFSLFLCYVSLLLALIACSPSPLFLPGVFTPFVFSAYIFASVSFSTYFFIVSFLLTFPFFPKLHASLLPLMHHLYFLPYFYSFSFPLVSFFPLYL